MDLARVSFIKNSSKEQLKDLKYLEILTVILGFNNEQLNEQPEIVKQNVGGLRIWQYPNQFSKYLLFLQNYQITSYLEIGCRWGGSFIFTNEYLKHFNTIRSVAIDYIDSPVKEYCQQNKETTFLQVNTRDQEFKDFIKQNNFDLVFIDGDHTYLGVKYDFETCQSAARIFVFHDIVNMHCQGVVNFWNDLKEKEKGNFLFFEFTEQYEEVINRKGETYLGIGVAIKI
jgi:cephalosporin hydroxylase